MAKLSGILVLIIFFVGTNVLALPVPDQPDRSLITNWQSRLHWPKSAASPADQSGNPNERGAGGAPTQTSQTSDATPTEPAKPTKRRPAVLKKAPPPPPSAANPRVQNPFGDRETARTVSGGCAVFTHALNGATTITMGSSRVFGALVSSFCQGIGSKVQANMREVDTRKRMDKLQQTMENLNHLRLLLGGGKYMTLLDLWQEYEKPIIDRVEEATKKIKSSSPLLVNGQSYVDDLGLAQRDFDRFLIMAIFLMVSSIHQSVIGESPDAKNAPYAPSANAPSRPSTSMSANSPLMNGLPTKVPELPKHKVKRSDDECTKATIKHTIQGNDRVVSIECEDQPSYNFIAKHVTMTM